jgi:hypothetical protein
MVQGMLFSRFIGCLLTSPGHFLFILVTIGITVGLFASNLAIATFISAARKLKEKGSPPRKTQVGTAF